MSKHFSEFLDGIQGIHMQLLSQTLNELNLSVSVPDTPERVNEFYNAILSANLRLTIELLESYHEWREQE